MMAQSLLTPEQLAKREKRKNLTVKEWNTDSKQIPVGWTVSKSMTARDAVSRRSSMPATARNGASPVLTMMSPAK